MVVMSFFVIHERCYWNIPPIKRPMGAIQSHLFRGWIFTNFAEHIENLEKIPQ
jgi:hypothetical protein